MSSSARQKEVLTQFIDAVWNQGRADECDRFLAPTYTIRHDPGDPWNGQTLDVEAFKNRVRISRAPFPDQQFSFVELVGAGDKVVMAWTWSATHAGDMPGFPATGKTITMTGATVYYFDGERITGHWQIVDRLSVFQQLQAGGRR